MSRMEEGHSNPFSLIRVSSIAPSGTPGQQSSPSSHTESTPIRTSDVDYRLLEASKAGDLETVKVS